jgi:cell wall-associated NlpC family hydrolase
LTAHDRRLHAFRADLADARLKGQVSAERFVTGRPARVTASVADVKKEPRADSGIDTQLIHGDDVLVFDETPGWVWMQCERDGYVGYVAEADIGPREHAPTHRVIAPRSFVYPGADLRFARAGELSMGSLVTVVGHAETRGTRYALLPSGEAVIDAHLAQLDHAADDFVAVAEKLINTPYLWGGVSGFGIDCSGLAQLSLLMAGRKVLRDSDMQAATVGEPIEPGPDFSRLQRGDFVFWSGHVAFMLDAENIIHASGNTMMVTREPLKDVIERIRPQYGAPSVFRRL